MDVVTLEPAERPVPLTIHAPEDASQEAAIRAAWATLAEAHERGEISFEDARALMWLLFDAKCFTLGLMTPIALDPGHDLSDPVRFCEAVRLDARTGLRALARHCRGDLLRAACTRARKLRSAVQSPRA